MAKLSGYIDLPSPSWIDNFRGPHWAPLHPLSDLLSGNVSSNINASLPLPPCLDAGKATASDCEGLEALQLFAGVRLFLSATHPHATQRSKLCSRATPLPRARRTRGSITRCALNRCVLRAHHQVGGGVTLELGGLDGIKLSETLLLEQHAGFRRIIIEADPKHRRTRCKLAPSVVGVTAAVCSDPGHLHYLHNAQTSGLAEFMSTEFIERWFPSLLPQLVPAPPSPPPLNVTPGCFIPDYNSWCRARTHINQARTSAPERICVLDLKCHGNDPGACGCDEPSDRMPRFRFISCRASHSALPYAYTYAPHAAS